MFRVFLYIDPGTGSMLFAIVISVIATLTFAFQGIIIKIKNNIGIKNINKVNTNKLDYVIYADDKRYWNVFKPICDEFEKRKIKIYYWTQSKDDPAFEEKYEYVNREFIGVGNKGFAKLNFLKAYICLSTTPGLDVFQWKKAKNCDVYVHVFHDSTITSGYKMFALDYYDVILLSNESQGKCVRELERKRNTQEKEIKVVGITYMDELLKKYNNTDRIKNDVPYILVASSWGDSCLLKLYGEQLLKLLFKTKYKIIVRPHPQMKSSDITSYNKMKELVMKNNAEWNEDNDNFNVLNKADIMISDFSSVAKDFALIFDKPIIVCDVKKDNNTYDECWLDEQNLQYKINSKLGRTFDETNINEIEKIIDNMFTDISYSQLRKNVKNLVWQNVGNASTSIVDYLTSKREKL